MREEERKTIVSSEAVEPQDLREGSENLGPIQKPKSLTEIAYETIKDGILSGKLAVGQGYSELGLAREMGISRTPIREALLKLETENFVVFHARKGVSINYFSKKDIEDLFELRQVIEETTMSKIMGKLSKDDIAFIRGIMNEQEKCIRNRRYDEKLFLELDKKFHLSIIELGRNKFTVQTYKNIRDYITITGRTKKERVKEVFREHEAIVEALSQNNIKKAKQAIRRHLSNSKLSVLEYEKSKVPSSPLER
jgi:DNA-binding GntR family transcriptional regulator